MAEQKTLKTQLAVLGAGPGGYVAAFHAADLGLDVTLIDLETTPGGVCLLRGCIPSKALLHARHAIVLAREAAEFGITFQAPSIDIDALREWKDSVIRKLTGGLQTLAKKREVRFVQARASFIDSGRLRLERAADDAPEPPAEELVFDQAILATGSRPILPGPLQVEDERVMTSTEALDIAEIPKRLLVVGGGYIGLELGQVYEGLGAKVTVVEMTEGLLPGTERHLVRPLQKALEKSFEAIHLDTRITELRPGDDGVTAVMEKDGEKREETFGRVLVSAGRRPNSEGLGLENTAVGIDERGFVQVDEQLRTGDPKIFAIGDVVGGMMLAHKASYEGKIAAEVAAGRKSVSDAQAIPAVIFSDPEIAYCGLTQDAARERGYEPKSARFPWAASGRALIHGQSAGLTEIVADSETGRILGAAMVGAGAGEMISEGVLAVEMAATAEDLAAIIHPHPTVSETLGEAAEKIFGQAIHGA